jgi:hypothetical protein
MTAAVPGAVSLALALIRAPAGVQAARAARFSHDVTVVLRLVTEDSTTTQQMMVATGASAAELREAAEFYLLQVCFMPGIDSYRVLAANRDDATTHIRDHYRLLVRWLHPDRNSDAWQTVFLDRVNRAWRDLRGSEERAEYERNVPPGVDHGDAPLLAAGLPLSVTGLDAGSFGKRVSARTMRRLPGMVLAGLGTLAVLVLAVMYLAHDATQVAESTYLAAESPDATVVPASSRFVRVQEPDTGLPSSTAAVAPTTVEATASVAATAVADPSAPSATAEVVSTEPSASATPQVPAPTLAKRGNASHRSVADRSPSPPDTAEPQPAVADVAATPAVSTQLESPDGAVSPVAAQAVSESSAASLASTDAATEAQDPLPAASSPAPAPAGSGVDQLLVDDLLQRFRSAYSDGDLIGLMALFTRDARNIAQGSQRLADEYRELFESSRARQLSLRDMTWWREGDMVAVVASFDAAITPVGRVRPKHIGGDIRFELRREDGEVRIARIRHQTQ